MVNGLTSETTIVDGAGMTAMRHSCMLYPAPHSAKLRPPVHGPDRIMMISPNRLLPLLRPSRRRSREDGFTLLEFLVVLVILGLLIGLVAPAAIRTLGSAKEKIAHQSIERIGTVLDMYKLDVGSFPSSDQGLAALLVKPTDAANWAGPYTKGTTVPTDPWGRPYVYRSPSSRQGYDYDLCTLGANGQGGGTGENATICNQ